MNMARRLFAVILCLACLQVLCAERTVFESRFDAGDLSGWMDVKGRTPPGEEHARITEEDGRRILMTSDNRWAGLSATFAEPVKVDGNLKKIVLRIRLKQAGKGFHGATVAITSRDSMDMHNGKAFATGKDSGFSVFGHTHREHNSITTRLDGRDAKTIRQSNPVRSPFFKAHRTWTDWTVVYDNNNKDIEVTVDGASAPALILHEVDLSGRTFRSFWISQFETAIEFVKVVYETK